MTNVESNIAWARAGSQVVSHTHAALRSKWIGRGKELDLLCSIITANNTFFPALHLFGPRNTGKTGLLLDVLNMTRGAYAYVDCSLSLSTQANFFATLQSQLAFWDAKEKEMWSIVYKHAAETENGAKNQSGTKRKRDQDKDNASQSVPHPLGLPELPCPVTSGHSGMTRDSIMHFSRCIQNLSNLSHKTIYLVIDQAQHLLERWPTLVSGLFRLQEATRRQICVIIVSNSLWQHMHENTTGGVQPLAIPFDPYNKSQLVKILCRTVETLDQRLVEEMGQGILCDVLKYVVTGLDHGTRDVLEITHSVRLLLPTLKALVKENEHKEKDPLAFLLASIRPHINVLFQELCHHELAEADLVARADERRKAAAEKGKFQPNKPIHDVEDALELPKRAKFVLLASFLASYNPAQEDRRLFSAFATKGRRKHRASCSSQTHATAVGPLLLGPKPFPLPRMVAILKSICSDASFVEGLEVQVASLTSLHLLDHVAATRSSNLSSRPLEEMELGSVRLRCNILHHDAQQIAKSIGINLSSYLYHPG